MPKRELHLGAFFAGAAAMAALMISVWLLAPTLLRYGYMLRYNVPAIGRESVKIPEVDLHEPGPMVFSKPAPFPSVFDFPLIATGEFRSSGITEGGTSMGGLRNRGGAITIAAGRIAVRGSEQGPEYSLPSGLRIAQIGEFRQHGEASALPLSLYASRVPKVPLPNAINPPNNKEVSEPSLVNGAYDHLFQPGSNQIFKIGTAPKRWYRITLGPGDYILTDPSSLQEIEVAPNPAGEFGIVRLFIQGEPAEKPIKMPRLGYLHGFPNSGSQTLVQVWYNGTGTLKINGINDLWGTIYAPKARIKIDGINHIFGSIIAHDIQVDGINTFNYDPRLGQVQDWNNIQIPHEPARPYLPYAAFALHNVEFKDKATILAGSVGAKGTVRINTQTTSNAAVEASATPAGDLLLPVLPPGKKSRGYSVDTETYIDPGTNELADLGAVDLTRQVYLGPGDYKVSKLKLTRGALNIVPGKNGKLGMVRIFVDADSSEHTPINLDDGAIGSGSTPGLVQIIYEGTKDIELSGKSLICGAVLAPHAYVNARGNAIIEGAVLGKDIVFENSSHLLYDSWFADKRNWGYKNPPRRER